MAKIIFYEEVRRMFNYCPETGLLSYKHKRGQGSKSKAGDAAGRVDESGVKNSIRLYLRVWIGKPVWNAYVHRIIWVWMTGQQPEEIDHIDGDGLNNKWRNLRSVPHSVNGKNQKLHATNTSGTAGVTQRKDNGRWRARIVVNGKMINLGTFIDKQQAIDARKEAQTSFY